MFFENSFLFDFYWISLTHLIVGYMPVGLTAPQNMKRESVFVNAEGVLDCAVDILTPKYDTSGVLRLYASYLYPSSYEGMNVVATNYEDYAVLHECVAGGVERVQVLC